MVVMLVAGVLLVVGALVMGGGALAARNRAYACAKCAHKNAKSAIYCAQCGEKL
jgi:hypothetical protein